MILVLGIPNWPWLLNPNESNNSEQDAVDEVEGEGEEEEEEEDQSQIPDWNWLINNYEKNETQEISSHDDEPEIDITPFMVKQQRQKNQEREIASHEDQVSNFTLMAHFSKS